MNQQSFEETVTKTLSSFLTPLFSKDIELKVIKEAEFLEKDFNYAVFISFVGAVEGVLLLRVDEDSTKRFIENLIIPNPNNEMSQNDVIKGYFGELANILMGKLIGFITEQVKNTEITTPSLISGHSMSFQIPFDNQCSAALSSHFADFHIVVYYKKNNE